MSGFIMNEEISCMRDEASANADEDKKQKEEIDKLNAADALVFQTEKQLKEYGDKLPEDKKGLIEEAVKELKTAHAGKDLAAIDTSMEKSNSIWQSASEEMYKNTQGDAAEGAQPNADPNTGPQGGTPNDDEVTDVDFEEVDDKK